MAIKTLTINSRLVLLLLGISASILASAYIIEHWLGIKPCTMCLYQRIPYYALVGLSLGQLVFSFEKLQKLFLYCYILLCLSSAALALYHVGIERGIVQEPIA